jgi:hypothetical protein
MAWHQLADKIAGHIKLPSCAAFVAQRSEMTVPHSTVGQFGAARIAEAVRASTTGNSQAGGSAPGVTSAAQGQWRRYTVMLAFNAARLAVGTSRLPGKLGLQGNEAGDCSGNQGLHESATHCPTTDRRSAWSLTCISASGCCCTRGRRRCSGVVCRC